jgi:hypothetical protein
MDRYSYDRRTPVRPNRVASRNHYPVDQSFVRKQLARTNDPDIRAESVAAHGGYYDMTFEVVPLRAIQIPSVWNPGRADKLQEAFDQGRPLPPVRLTKVRGRLEVEDGIHRINVSKERGFTHVPALISTWVEQELPPAEQEKPQLPVGTWVRLNPGVEPGFEYGWIVSHLGHRMMNRTRRWLYEVALVTRTSDYPDFADLTDTTFEPHAPPPWGEAVRQQSGLM